MQAAIESERATFIGDPKEFVAARIKELATTDSQFGAALPLPAVNAAKLRPDLGLAQIVAACMEAYAGRAALGERAAELLTDPASGRTTRQLLGHFDTVSYRELWSRARALAGFWHYDDHRSLRANDLLCIIAFAGVDFATVDLGAIHNGAVVVPLQTNAPLTQLLASLH